MMFNKLITKTKYSSTHNPHSHQSPMGITSKGVFLSARNHLI